MAEKETACYKDEKGVWKVIHIHDWVDNMKIDPHLWKQTYEYYTLHPDIEKKVPLHGSHGWDMKKKGASFCFYSDEDRQNAGKYSEETYAHWLSKKVIQNLKEIKLKISIGKRKSIGKEIELIHNYPDFKFEYNEKGNLFYVTKIKPLYFKHEHNLKFNDTIKYRPDLIVYFNEPKYLAKKWKGRLAVEVFVTHKVDLIKAFDFRKYNLAMFEVNIGDKLMEGPRETKGLTYEQAYNNYIYNSFKKNGIMGKIESNPSTNDYLVDEVNRFKSELIDAQKRIISLCDERNSKQDNYYLKLEDQWHRIRNLEKELNSSLTEYQTIKNQFNAHINRSFFRKFIDLFKKVNKV